MTRAAVFLVAVASACVGAAPDGAGAPGGADGSVGGGDAAAPDDAALIGSPTWTPVDIPVTGYGHARSEHHGRRRPHARGPFRDWYDNILAYGELWGEDESFSWHPFEHGNFVDSDGDVVNFNYDDRVLRSDFVGGGVLAPYSPNQHPDGLYRKLPGEWKNYAY